MRYEFPKAHRGEFGPIRKACELMIVSKSGYYEYIHRRKPNAQIEREALEGFVKDVFEQHRARYGYRRINRELRKMDILVGDKRALHIMRRLGYTAEGAARKHRRQKAVEPGDPGPNTVERSFSVGGKDKLRMGGIACIPTREGWLYPACAIGAFPRKAVGWPMPERIAEKLAIDAIGQAVGRGNPPNGGRPVFHDDQGVRYASRAFQGCLDSRGINAIYFQAGDAVGQRSCRIVLQNTEERTVEGQGLQNEGGGYAGYLQIHRAVLQHGSHALGAQL